MIMNWAYSHLGTVRHTYLQQLSRGPEIQKDQAKRSRRSITLEVRQDMSHSISREFFPS